MVEEKDTDPKATTFFNEFFCPECKGKIKIGDILVIIMDEEHIMIEGFCIKCNDVIILADFQRIYYGDKIINEHRGIIEFVGKHAHLSIEPDEENIKFTKHIAREIANYLKKRDVV
jgi:hypothetical protein